VSSELRNNKVVISQEEKIFSNNQEKKVAKFFDKNYQQSLKVCEGDTLEDFATPKKKKVRRIWKCHINPHCKPHPSTPSHIPIQGKLIYYCRIFYILIQR
jgi:hypothetical protein